MNSLEWSKKYDVYSVSRISLSALGFSFEQIKSLTDDDMQAIGYGLQEFMSVAFSGFHVMTRRHVLLYLEEKESKRRYSHEDYGPVTE